MCGMNVKKWDPVVAEAEKGVEITSDNQASDIVYQTIEEISQNGYCLWTCRNLDNTTICIIDNPVSNLPSAYPVYTLHELEMLSGANAWVERLILEAKKAAGAVVYKVEKMKTIENTRKGEFAHNLK
jgi:hypothetical protein